jgi:acetyltransferase-like isoleucine patch superfamily enzyme
MRRDERARFDAMFEAVLEAMPPEIHELIEEVPVVLEDHCFIGVNAVVMPGVTVGRASVVGSGAVVTADVPPLTMVAGNPARIIKRFGE